MSAAPTNLEECLQALDRQVDSATKTQIRSLTEPDVIRLHDNLGRWIRNNWLGDHESLLYRYFRELELTSKDEMSYLVLRAFWRKLNDRRIDLEGLVEEARLAEGAVQPPDAKDCPTYPGVPMDMQVEISSVDQQSGRMRVLHVARCPVDGQYWIFEYGRGWSAPTPEQRRQIAENPRMRSKTNDGHQ
jgi:hypothetical protein